jgi:DNA-binding response OmpR family regulator
LIDQSNPFAGMRVPAVADQETQRHFRRDCPEAEMFVVGEAVNGSSGLEINRSGYPDLVLLDVNTSR